MAAQRKPKVVVILEDIQSAKQLIQSLCSFREITTEVWNITHGVLDPYTTPDRTAVYYSRLSPSGRTRGNPDSFEYGRNVLEWLNRYGCRVFNGLGAMRLDGSKAIQWLEMDKAGFPRLDRILVCGEHAAPMAIQTHLGVPYLPSDMDNLYATRPGDRAWYLKPNHGGSGAGVRRFSNASEVRRIANVHRKPHGGDEPLKNAPFNMYVFEESVPDALRIVTSTKQKTTMYRRFYRAEFINNRCLYVVLVDAEDTAKNLCPCEEVHSEGVRFTVIPSPSQTFGPHRWSRFESACQKLIGETGVDFVCFEFAVKSNGMLFVYDINCNTNYNAPAERVAAIAMGGYQTIATTLRDAAFGDADASTELGTDMTVRKLNWRSSHKMDTKQAEATSGPPHLSADAGQSYVEGDTKPETRPRESRAMSPQGTKHIATELPEPIAIAAKNIVE